MHIPKVLFYFKLILDCEIKIVDLLIDWIEFYALTTIFQACKGGKIVEQFFYIEIRNIRISIRYYFIFYQLAVKLSNIAFV